MIWYYYGQDDDIMKSTHIHLTDNQHKLLAKVVKDTGIGKAELIRRAIDSYLAGLLQPQLVHGTGEYQYILPVSVIREKDDEPK